MKASAVLLSLCLQEACERIEQEFTFRAAVLVDGNLFTADRTGMCGHAGFRFIVHGRRLRICVMAPEAGFEPAVGCPTSVFETDTFGLSVIPAYGFRQAVLA